MEILVAIGMLIVNALALALAQARLGCAPGGALHPVVDEAPVKVRNGGLTEAEF